MKHHIVQDKYLRQWFEDESDGRLWVYTFSDDKLEKRGPGWKGFWRQDFNIYDDKDDYYLPEQVSAHIDNEGITVIKGIAYDKQLDGYQRSCLAFYTALQYVRTPKFRDDTNAMLNATTKHFMRADIKNVDDVNMSRSDILREEPSNELEKEAHRMVAEMSELEFKETIYKTIHSDDFKVRLNNAGHSKQILKVDKYAKDIFEFAWTILMAPDGTTFVTSDAPCFPFAYNNDLPGAGLCSPNAVTVFPLTPRFCLWIDPSIKGKREAFTKISKSDVRNINLMIMRNSNDLVAARDRGHLVRLTKRYKHNKGREVSVKTIGPYTIFN